jgi:nitrite reductase/ring-hydroxylating ferredoxin subunit
MSWLTERLMKLLAERNLAADTVARQLAIERSRMTLILAGTREPNENLVKRFAAYFGEDTAEWLANAAQPQAPDQLEKKPVPAGFLTVARVADVPPGEMIMVHDATAVVANVDGQFYAFGNVCPHAGGNLGEGFLEGCIVECPWHAGRWDVRTGQGLTILSTADIQVFAVRITGEDIEIKLG